MSMVDIAVTRELIRAIRGLQPSFRHQDAACWCPTDWHVGTQGHSGPCVTARAAIYEARKAGY